MSVYDTVIWQRQINNTTCCLVFNACIYIILESCALIHNISDDARGGSTLMFTCFFALKYLPSTWLCNWCFHVFIIFVSDYYINCRDLSRLSDTGAVRPIQADVSLDRSTSRFHLLLIKKCSHSMSRGTRYICSCALEYKRMTYMLLVDVMGWQDMWDMKCDTLMIVVFFYILRVSIKNNTSLHSAKRSLTSRSK